MSRRNTLTVKAERRSDRQARHHRAHEQIARVGRHTECRCCRKYKRTLLDGTCERCVRRLASLWGEPVACQRCLRAGLYPPHHCCRRCTGRAVGRLFAGARW